MGLQPWGRCEKEQLCAWAQGEGHEHLQTQRDAPPGPALWGQPGSGGRAAWDCLRPASPPAECQEGRVTGPFPALLFSSPLCPGL